MLTFDFSAFPTLETERLQLRQLRDADVNEIFALRSDPVTMQFIPRPLAKTNDDALAHIALINENTKKNTGINWAINQKGSDRLIGLMGFHRLEPENFRAEIGYMMLPGYQGQGFTTEGIQCIVAYAFTEMKLHSIEAIIDPGNIASARVLEKNHFTKEAHLRENWYYDGKFLDTVIYSRLATD